MSYTRSHGVPKQNTAPHSSPPQSMHPGQQVIGNAGMQSRIPASTPLELMSVEELEAIAVDTSLNPKRREEAKKILAQRGLSNTHGIKPHYQNTGNFNRTDGRWTPDQEQDLADRDGKRPISQLFGGEGSEEDGKRMQSDWQGVEKEVSLAKVDLFKTGASATYYSSEDDALQVGHVQAGTEGGVEVGPNGVKAEAKASASANLVKLDKTWTIESNPVTFLNETFSGRLFLSVNGMVGAEAKAQIEANATLMSSKGVADPDMLLEGVDVETTADSDVSSDGPGAGVEASGSVFVGAKMSVGAGGAFEWHQKNEVDYAKDIEASSGTLLSIINRVNPGLGWLLNEAGVGDSLPSLIGELLDWKAGRVKMLGAEAVLEGSAGLGAKLDAALGFSGGQLSFKWSAGITFGLGAGVSVNVSVDALEGIKLAVVCLSDAAEAASELGRIVSDWLQQNAVSLVGAVADLWDDLMDWLEADDKIREAVANRGHEATPAEMRGQWIVTLSEGWCADEDEDAIIEILRFSSENGDLSTVLSAGLSADEIISELGGAQDTQARAILGVS